MRKSPATLLLNLFLYQHISVADPVIYNDIYLSYVSAQAAGSIATYVKQQNLGGIFLWELRGDTGFNEQSSLLQAVNAVWSDQTLRESGIPLIIGYWNDNNVYTMNPATRAIPEPPYGVPGSVDIQGNLVINRDFRNKLNGINAIAYSFVNAQTLTFTYQNIQTGVTTTVSNKTPEAIGTLFFNDPYSDLFPPGVSATQDIFCQKNSTICNFALENRTTPLSLKDGAKMGNFDAFANLRHATNDNLFGPLLKIVSVGGYGHDDTFEDTFNSPNGMDNFVNSAKALIDAYQLDGIDLDYENPQMTTQNAENFVTLVKKLKVAMPDKILSVTILADPAFLNGTYDGQYGFANGTLASIARNVTNINLITFDFFGPFYFVLNGTNTTKLLTNLTAPTDSPITYTSSIENSVNAALRAGVDPSQLIVGIPAFGRALAGIDDENGGLFNSISTDATIPRGNLDTGDCDTSITPFTSTSCSGGFQYNYILNNMLGNGVVERERRNDGIVIGTTGYGTIWSPNEHKFQLQIANDGVVGDLPFNVTIGSFAAPDFFNVGDGKTYDELTTTSINGREGLPVRWTNEAGQSGQCNSLFDFTQNTRVTITVIPERLTGQFVTICTYTAIGSLQNTP